MQWHRSPAGPVGRASLQALVCQHQPNLTLTYIATLWAERDVSEKYLVILALRLCPIPSTRRDDSLIPLSKQQHFANAATSTHLIGAAVHKVHP